MHPDWVERSPHASRRIWCNFADCSMVTPSMCTTLHHKHTQREVKDQMFFSSRCPVRWQGQTCTPVSPTMCSTISPSTGSVLPLTSTFPVRAICLVFRTSFQLRRMLIGSDRFWCCVRQRACLGSRSAQCHLGGAPRQPCSAAAPSAQEQRT
jgi:hypothetical protein